MSETNTDDRLVMRLNDFLDIFSQTDNPTVVSKGIVLYTQLVVRLRY